MRREFSPAILLLPALGCALLAGSLPAQEPVPVTHVVPAQEHVGAVDTAGAFLDPGAAVLLERARAARLHTDRAVRSYTALIRSRMSMGLRMPLKDRTLVRYEQAVRVRWSRDGADVVQVLAGRGQSPGGVTPGVDVLHAPFNPGEEDRLYLGVQFGSDEEEDDFWIEHPLGERGERHYRYQSGDTLTIRLQDGRSVKVAELRVIPRRTDPKTIRGVLWIEATSGALVQAAFRLGRKVDILGDMSAIEDEDRKVIDRVPFITPLEFDISLMTVEYSLWDMEHWLPRSMRLEGMVRTGIMHFPGTFDVSYRLLDVETDADPVLEPEADVVARLVEEWSDGLETTIREQTFNNRVEIRMVPTDQSLLLESEHLPPPVWADAPDFVTQAEITAIHDRIARVPLPRQPDLPIRFGWGYGEPGMLRYNRVEALSVGARLTAPLPYVTLTATGRVGVGDLHPNAELLVSRETMRRSLELRGYHALATVDPSRRAFGAGNSLAAFLFGRDEGEYYRATGAELAMSPPPHRRRSWEARTYVERQDAVARNTHFSLPRAWADSVFRPNIRADAATQYGALIHLRPWSGTDPTGAQLGLDFLLQGETGDFDHARARLTLRGAAPLPGGLRVGAEAGAGTSEGRVPVQRHYFLGGASTLRGYEPSALTGTSMARGRLELARATSYANMALFSDWGWAGDRDHIRRHDSRWSLGAGASLLDGLIRLDLARGMDAPRRWRLDLHMDAVL